MDGPGGYYDELNKSDRETQMPYVFTYMWNLKNKINEQVEQKQSDWYRENFDSCHIGGLAVEEVGEKGEEVKKYKLAVRKQSWVCKEQHEGYSQ